MAKKKNPEQENPPVQEQETEPQQQEETPAQEEPTQEQQPQEQDPEQQEDPEEEESGEEEEDPSEDPGEQPQEEPAQEPARQPESEEADKLRAQLLQAQGRLAAYGAGVIPAMVDDAVTLAMAEAARTGTVTEASVTAAMDAVLKRHPEWKAEQKKTTGGFKLGADRDNGGTQKKPGTTQNTKRWNRFK